MSGKKYLILAAVLFVLSENIYSQIYWLNSLKTAESIAQSTGRLIVMDFWASWCGPCRTMDRELWESSEMKDFSKNFVGVRINVDFEKTLTSFYGVRSIPKVMIIASNGDRIWEKDGFMNAGEFLPVFEAIPENVGELYKKLSALEKNKNDFRASFLVGVEYQQLGKEMKNSELKNSFLNRSETFLNKAVRLCDDPVQAEEIELNSILNDVYCDRIQKALKSMEKINPQLQDETIAELRHFIMALCYKSTSDHDNYQKERQQIRKKEYLAQLDD